MRCHNDAALARVDKGRIQGPVSLSFFPSHYPVFGMQARSEEFKLTGDLVHSGKLKVTIQEDLPFTEESRLRVVESEESYLLNF